MKTNTRTTVDDLEGIDEGQHALLSAERDELLSDLRSGLSPVVCLSGPGEPRRMVRLTSVADLASRRLPWSRLPR